MKCHEQNSVSMLMNYDTDSTRERSRNIMMMRNSNFLVWICGFKGCMLHNTCIHSKHQWVLCCGAHGGRFNLPSNMKVQERPLSCANVSLSGFGHLQIEIAPVCVCIYYRYVCVCVYVCMCVCMYVCMNV